MHCNKFQIKKKLLKQNISRNVKKTAENKKKK